jgi:outer membrane receptor for ferrienterochelin and colicin
MPTDSPTSEKIDSPRNRSIRFARIDNVFDRRYVGSVIVNEGNARYFEPPPGRNWVMEIDGAFRF